MKGKQPACKHDHKNAIQIGKIDFVCPLCRNLIDPGEWFLMNYFTFVDEIPQKEKQSISTARNTRKQIKSKTVKFDKNSRV